MNSILRSLLLLVLISAPLHAGDSWHGVKGTLTRESDGRDLPFEIQTRMGFGTAKMRAYDPATKTLYSGNYRLIRSGRDCDARGVLHNPNGGVITLSFTVQPGVFFTSPHGVGEGEDNNKVHYSLEF